MPSYALNNITAPDQYDDSSSLGPLGLVDHINLDVSNQAVYWSLLETSELATDRSGTWQTEVYMLPGSRTINRPNILGIRVRAAVPASGLPAGSSQAQVTIEAVI